MILDSYFNENKLHQRGLDKRLGELLPSVNFLMILKRNLSTNLKSNFSNISLNSSSFADV